MKHTHAKEIFTPPNWSPEVWKIFNKKMEGMTKEELAKSFRDLGLTFTKPEDITQKSEYIAVADELRESDVRKYFKI